MKLNFNILPADPEQIKNVIQKVATLRQTKIDIWKEKFSKRNFSGKRNSDETMKSEHTLTHSAMMEDQKKIFQMVASLK